MESYKKSYAEAVIGCNVLLSQSCWSHIQTQDEEDALVLALQDSLSMQVGKVLVCDDNLRTQPDNKALCANGLLTRKTVLQLFLTFVFFQSELAGKDVHNPIKELVRQRPSKVTNRRFKEVSFHIIYNNKLSR